jgi:leucyl-tRNA synthetase
MEIVQKMGIESQDDPMLEEATKEIYKAGFHTGRMRENCGQFAGKPVAVAKEEVKVMMLEMGVADIMYDLSEPVICRCGGKVIVKQIPDQWFINYGHEEVTGIAKAHVPGMSIQPQDFKDNLPSTLDWFKERACARLGNWLGTPFPFDERWTIEPISDSTLYSAYYLVSNHIRNGCIDPEKLDDAFFDHVFLGKGTPSDAAATSGIDPGIIERIRNDFEYWYPLDVNLGGKEHQTVHFPVFLMNHAAILPDKLPRGIFVNYWIIGKSGKMSKSKGGAEPIPDAASTYTVDGLRLYYCHIASPHVDVEWDSADAYNSRKSVERAWNFACELLDMSGGLEQPMDRWLESKMRNHIVKCGSLMDELKLREAANIIYFEMPNDLRWYIRRGGDSSALMRRAVDAWIRMMAPFTPHMAEELWEMSGHGDMVSAASYPNEDCFNSDPGAELAEKFVENLLEDVSGILKMTGLSPKKLCLYTAPAWKYRVQSMMVSDKKDMGAVMKEMLAEPDMKSKSKEISAFASKLMKDIKKFGDGGIPAPGAEDELAVLKSARKFLESEYGCSVMVFAPEDPEIFDPGSKRNVGTPGKPAIYVE